MIKLGAKYTLATRSYISYECDINRYYSISHLDTIEYLLNRGYKFKYEYVVQLYKSLNEECYSKPQKFNMISKRMMKSLELCY